LSRPKGDLAHTNGTNRNDGTEDKGHTDQRDGAYKNKDPN
jgi:hypothetical protein